MISKIEILLLILILFFASGSVYVRTKTHDVTESKDKKELEFKTASLREANQSVVLNKVTASTMIKRANKIIFTDLRLNSKDLVLTASVATQKDNMITLEKNVTVKKRDGTSYYATDVTYDRKSTILYLDHKFKMQNKLGTLVGESMRYRMNRNNVKANMVKADYKMK